MQNLLTVLTSFGFDVAALHLEAGWPPGTKWLGRELGWQSIGGRHMALTDRPERVCEEIQEAIDNARQHSTTNPPDRFRVVLILWDNSRHYVNLDEEPEVVQE